MIQRQEIEKNFSRAAAGYKRYAVLQKNSAATLAEYLFEKTGAEPENILELGCGTGFLSEHLVRKYPYARFTFVDISAAMLEQCRSNLENKFADIEPRAEYICRDLRDAVSNAEPAKDMIVSGLTLQWIADLEKLLENCRRILRSGGILAFSTLTEDTFRNVRAEFEKLNTAFPGPALPSEKEVKCICRKHFRTKTKTETVREKYPSIRAFLKQIQDTGAGNPDTKKVPVHILRKIMAENKKVSAEYHLLYAICAKNTYRVTGN